MSEEMSAIQNIYCHKAAFNNKKTAEQAYDDSDKKTIHEKIQEEEART